MTADIRMALENEMDHMDESMVESWIQRCFESCDPRYDTDWLMGMFELALMQFPDNYEIRAAASKASTMEAQRLYDEGDTQEAVSRLERLLESDPYCTDAFEMLERFMQGSATEVAPAPEAPVAVPLLVLEPVPVQAAPVVEISPLPESHDDDLLSFLDDNLMIDGLHEPLPATETPAISLAPPVEPVAVAPPVEALAPPPPLEAPPVFVENTPVALEPPPAFVETEPVALESRPVIHEAPVAAAPPPVVFEAPPVVMAPPPVVVAPPPVVVAPPPVAVAPPPVAVAPPPVAVAPPPVAVAPPPVAERNGSFDWRTVVGLPAHAQHTLEPQLEAILPSLTERFSQVGNYRSLVMLLTDLYQRDPSHQGVSHNLNSVLHDWAAQLEKQGRGQEAGQVAAWSQQLLGSKAAWTQSLVQRFPSQPPSLPDLSGLSGIGSPGWMNWVAPLREDPSRYQDAGQALAGDPQGLQSLFRHLAVQHPEQPDHVLNLGWAYSHTGQHALAMVHTQRSLQMRQSARAYELLQKVYGDLGQPEMAQRVAQQLSQLRG